MTMCHTHQYYVVKQLTPPVFQQKRKLFTETRTTIQTEWYHNNGRERRREEGTTWAYPHDRSTTLSVARYARRALWSTIVDPTKTHSP